MIGSGELIVILCLGLLLFGGKKLPEFARNLGRGIREFKKACSESDCDVIDISPSCEKQPPAPKDANNTDTP